MEEADWLRSNEKEKADWLSRYKQIILIGSQGVNKCFLAVKM